VARISKRREDSPLSDADEAPPGIVTARPDPEADEDLFADEEVDDGGSGGNGSAGGRRRRYGGDDDDDADDSGGMHPVARSAPRRRSGLIGFVQGSWRELQRVQWPDQRQVVQATGVVLGFVIVAGAYLGLADWVATKIVNFII
jgi:preprotein translocase SecE subunit